MTRDYFSPKSVPSMKTKPFDSVEEAWFWFIQAQQARNDGARFAAGQGLIPRPCEPMDILRILDRLYRQRRLLRDHLLVLRHYGRRLMRPDARRVKEARASAIWDQALERLAPALEKKEIVKKMMPPADSNWHEHAVVFERMITE